MNLIDGNATSLQIKEEIKTEVAELVAQGKRKPHLAAILMGNDGASETYVNHKVKSCGQVGFDSTLVRLEAHLSEEELLKEVEKLNQDPYIDGFIVQLPLPKHINQEKIIMAIDPKKDVDGFHPENFGKLALELDTYISATPFGIIELLQRYQIETSGKNVVVIGRSRIVGKPIALLLGSSAKYGNATVTIAHSRTQNLAELTQKADIIVAAIGSPEFLKGEMVKEGAVIIDVGITRVEDATKKSGYKLLGDVHFESVAPKSSYITPVPGGVGPMTVTMLLKNTLLAYHRYGKQ